MAVVKTTSEVYQINSPIADVYSFLSDFNRIGVLANMAKQMGMGGQEKLAELSEKIEDIRFTEDACTLVVKGMGDVVIKIVEKEYPKLIKLSGDGVMPFEFNIWIQLLDKGPYDTRLRITLEADVNLMMKLMLKGKIEKGINQLAQGLTQIPYSMLK